MTAITLDWKTYRIMIVKVFSYGQNVCICKARKAYLLSIDKSLHRFSCMSLKTNLQIISPDSRKVNQNSSNNNKASIISTRSTAVVQSKVPGALAFRKGGKKDTVHELVNEARSPYSHHLCPNASMNDEVKEDIAFNEAPSSKPQETRMSWTFHPGSSLSQLIPH